tara:strand:- start:401 stop:1012 length:612 start_codon:yes stop_codon:yes gene_type:complete
MSKKPIIVFEGIEGSGKSLYINYVSNFLKSKKIKFIKIREPGGSNNSERIRKLILDNNSNFQKYTDLLLYLAARSENVAIIKKNIGNKIILIDRFVDSTIAYQHFGMGLNLKIINNVNQILLGKIKVNFTFLNLVNKINMKKRLSMRKKLNRYDKFKSVFYTRVQKGFIKIANKNRNKYLKINSNLDIKVNKKIIISKILKLI